MIITISGKAGSGKSTIAKMLTKKLKIKHYSVGDVMRKMAAEKGISLLDLNRLAEKDRSIDLELDSRLKRLGKEEDNFVIDGRLTAFFIPNAEARVFLTANDKVRAQRIMNDKRHQEKSKNISEMTDNIRKREESEKKRYKKYYSIDYTDKKLYNCIIDTTKLSPNRVVERIIKFVKMSKAKARKI